MTAFWFETALLESGWAQHVRVETHNGVISTVTPDSAARHGDEIHAIAVPGQCNVHSHAFQRGMAGLSEHRGEGSADDNFWSWREVMYRFLDRLDPDAVEAITAQAYVEMLESGYTRVGEFHYLHNDVDGRAYADPTELSGRIIAAAQNTGIGLTLLPVFYAHSDFGGHPPKYGQRRFIHNLDSYAQLLESSRALLQGDMNMGIAPHSLRAVTGEELTALLTLSPIGPVHIHAAEQVKEIEASIAFSGLRPVEYLLAHAGLDARWCLIHATHLTDAECDALAASGAVAGLCPITEANLGDGIFPAIRFLDAGGAIGTGTDSNILIDMAGELRAIEYSQRLSHKGRNMLASQNQSTGTRLFTRALQGGAQALGVKPGIAAGASADIVTLDAHHPALDGRKGDLLLDSWIFSGRSGCVDAVWRHGKRVVSNGRHHEAERISTRYRAVVRKLLSI